MKEKAETIGRIAIFYPWSNIDTLPSLRDSIVLLVDHGFHVDLFTLRDGPYPLPSFSSSGVSVFTTPEVFADAGIVTPSWTYGRGGRPYGWMVSNLYRPLWRKLYFKRMMTKRHASLPYIFIIGMDPEGLSDAAPLAEWLRVPLLYWSLELLFSDESNTKKQQTLKSKEIQLSRRAAFTFIQDDLRAYAIINENGLDPGKVLLVPNAPMGIARRRRTSFLRERFHIVPERKIVLCAGTLRWWAMSKEIVEAAAYWADEYVLVMHSRQNFYEYGSEYVNSVVRSADPRHVIFSFDPVTSKQYQDLLDSADIGLAFYNPFLPSAPEKPNRNLELMGFSSGKLSGYLKSGLPVVVNQAEGIRQLIESYNCGICVQDRRDITDALATIVQNYDLYSENACRCFNEKLELTVSFENVIQRLKTIMP